MNVLQSKLSRHRSSTTLLTLKGNVQPRAALRPAAGPSHVRRPGPPCAPTKRPRLLPSSSSSPASRSSSSLSSPTQARILVAAAAASGGAAAAGAAPGSSAASDGPAGSVPLGVLFEVDGALMDVHLDGHREAFNAAFQSIGMDCVNWSPVVYHDLLGCSDGSGEGLVRAYFGTVGWPLMLATSDRGAFVRRVQQLKEQQLERLLARDAVPLRQDVRQVISDAVSDGAAVSLLAGTQCVRAEQLAASCVRQLGPELTAAGGPLRVFTFSLAPPSPDSSTSTGGASGGGGEGAEGEGGDVGAGSQQLSQLLSAAAGDLKQRAALQLVCSWQQSVGKGGGEGGDQEPVGLGVDPSLLAAGGSQQRLSPEFLSALVATTGVAAGRTLAVAASNGVMQAAAGAGLVPVAVPRKFATQGTFPAAVAKFEGFGAGAATWPRLRSLLLTSSANNSNSSSGGSGSSSSAPQR
ncbi:hypothetical protein Agub_g8731 [Astrephomene gubernaculifera]|uniref:Uncharacterized protein n=1 Tax=Astrephomene gubernaculifera TaxID=47775 RepID=A0AAD3HNG8_9CHLO|nr:hypothetical protein Agub_g8731 [Astrephomene gubernaculifera]